MGRSCVNALLCHRNVGAAPGDDASVLGYTVLSMKPEASLALEGRTIADKFVIESVIGQGAMGAVYRARAARARQDRWRSR